MDIILIPGLWLRGDSWSGVEVELARMGHRVHALTLPGQDDFRSDATLQDQLDLVVSAVDRADSPALVVGHSAASTLAWMAADTRPETVAGVVMVGGMTVGHGKPYANFFPVEEGQMSFPGWEAFRETDTADLGEHQRRRIETEATPVSEDVCLATAQLSDVRRFDVPVVVVCAGYSPAEVREWIDEGHVPELTAAKRVTLINIDAGHWPMLTQPGELATIIDGAARGGSEDSSGATRPWHRADGST